MMSNSARIDIVVLNYNTRDLLAQCLPVVLRESQVPGARVVLVDNHSNDGSADYVRTQFPEIHLIELPENAGYAGGYNQAIAQLDADYYSAIASDSCRLNGRTSRPELLNPSC